MLLVTGYEDSVTLCDLRIKRYYKMRNFEDAVLKVQNETRVLSIAFDVSGKYLAAGGARGVTCDGGGYADNDGDSCGECDDGCDGCREHCDVCACDHPPLSCSSS
jgi:hypothetical protein